jgi:HK97 family phage portal protein
MELAGRVLASRSTGRTPEPRAKNIIAWWHGICKVFCVNLLHEDFEMSKRKVKAKAPAPVVQRGNRVTLYQPEEEKAQGASVQAPSLMNLSSYFMSPRSGTREILELYSHSPWLRAIVNKIGKAVAETAWLLFAAVDPDRRYFKNYQLLSLNGKTLSDALKQATVDGTAEKIVTHPLLNLLLNGTGDARLNGFSCMQVTTVHLDLVGEGFWLLERNALGVPYAYWPLPPSWVKNLPTRKEPFYEVHTAGGDMWKIPVTEIIAFIDPDPANPYGRGSGVAKALDDEIQIDEFAAKHQKSFFLNRARPDVIISGTSLSRPDAERLEKKWMSDHQGFWKAFKPLFFSQKIDVKELSQTFEAMQMVQVRKQERDTFINVFGMPPEKLGVINESKRSTINAADYFWNKDIIRPRVESIRRVLQMVLVPMFDDRLILAYNTPVVQEDEYRLEVIDEWRKEGGAEPIGGALGNALFMPLNNQLVATTGPDGGQISAEDLRRLFSRENLTEDQKKLADQRDLVLAITDVVLSGLRSELKALPIATIENKENRN